MVHQPVRSAPGKVTADGTPGILDPWLMQKPIPISSGPSSLDENPLAGWMVRRWTILYRFSYPSFHALISSLSLLFPHSYRGCRSLSTIFHSLNILRFTRPPRILFTTLYHPTQCEHHPVLPLQPVRTLYSYHNRRRHHRHLTTIPTCTAHNSYTNTLLDVDLQQQLCGQPLYQNQFESEPHHPPPGPCASLQQDLNRLETTSYKHHRNGHSSDSVLPVPA